jgi:hypothetical protein
VFERFEGVAGIVGEEHARARAQGGFRKRRHRAGVKA